MNRMNHEYFTVEQLSIIFGVSITTINNWIRDGRFLGVRKTDKNTHIPVVLSTLWLSRQGELYSVADILKEWIDEQEKQGENEFDKNEVKFLVDQMSLYEVKYGGDFECTMESKEKLSPEEESDKASWDYLRKKFNRRI